MVLNTSKEYLSFMISPMDVVFMGTAMLALYNAVNDGLNPFFDGTNRRHHLIATGTNTFLCAVLIIAAGW